jgi:hypothetical protein
MHHELPARLDLEWHRKDAKALVRAYRAGDAEARDRAEDVLGERARERFGLTDAQFVIAVEHGHRSWADFRRALEAAPPEGPVARIGLDDVPAYEERARALVAALAAGDDDARRRVEAHLPRFAGGTDLSLREAKVVVAHEYGFPTWRLLVHFVRKDIEHAARPPAEPRVLGREAVAAGDVERLRALLDEHAGLADELLEDLTQPDVFGERLGRALGVDRRAAQLLVERAGNRDLCLNIAACFDRVELVRMLLDAGADDESIEVWGVTPLETALYHGARGAAELLAERKIVPLALWSAAALGRVDLLAELYGTPAAGAHRPDLSKVGWGPGAPQRDDPREIEAEALMHAAHNGRDEAVAWLLDRGADVDAAPYLGFTALHAAVQFGHFSTVRLLVNRGARLDVRDELYHGTPRSWAEHLIAEGAPLEAIRDFLALREQAEPRLAAIRAELAALGEHDELVLASGVHVRRRGHRYAIDDGGAAVALAGRPPGWRDAARRVAEDEFWLNLSRDGVVFVPAVEGGVYVPWLATRVEDASRAVRDALLDLDAG